MGSRKKEVIGEDGRMRTLIRGTSSRKKRVDEHLHGRSDHIRPNDAGLRFVVRTTALVLGMGVLFFLLWKLLG